MMRSFAEVVRALEGSSHKLVAIDGLPLAGKTTLAERVARCLGADILALDDFLLPQSEWPAEIAPGFPFPFFRIEELRSAVAALHRGESCAFRAFDWDTGELAARALTGKVPVVVEGCSALDPELAPLYDLRIFVASDRATLLDAQRARDAGHGLNAFWPKLFLPSVDRYLETGPERRADVVVGGRGCSPTPVLETTRLVLRPPTRDHAEGFFRMRAHPEATRFLFVAPFGSVEDAAASMERIALQRVTGKTVSWAITLRDGGAFIGVCGLVRVDHGTGSAHVAYELDARHWGHGFMSEALARVLAYGRDELGLTHFEAHIDPENERSIRLATRLGFTYSHSTREADGPGPDDTAIYRA
jgi:RimJ/RimL family protein N-acetyltransferase